LQIKIQQAGESPNIVGILYYCIESTTPHSSSLYALWHDAYTCSRSTIVVVDDRNNQSVEPVPYTL